MSRDRYKPFKINETLLSVPFIEIPVRDSDIYITFNHNIDSLDYISYKYYSDEDYDWLILQANPEVGSLEFDIPENTILRIPFPLNQVLNDYFEKAENERNNI